MKSSRKERKRRDASGRDGRKNEESVKEIPERLGHFELTKFPINTATNLVYFCTGLSVGILPNKPDRRN